MSIDEPNMTSRRQLLRDALTAALLSGWGGTAHAFPERAEPQSLREVLNVAHLDRVAQRRLPPAVYHFIVGASDDGLTKRENRLAYERVRIRPRRLVDVSSVDASCELFGRRYASPIILAPVGNQQLIHPDGDLATARAAADRQHLMIAAMLSNYSIGEIAAVGGATWLQLYPSPNRDFLRKLLGDAAAAGCEAIVLTVDGPTRGNHEAERWFALHRDPEARPGPSRLGNLEGFKGRKGIGDAAFTWKDIEWLREQTSLKLLLKGIVTSEDAALCRRSGVDGVIVSNHGGRQEGNGRATLDVLPEVVDALRGRMPVLVDGGIRRGADAFKAIALGASAVCIGRPYLWGLGAFGQDGVDKCLKILQSELVRTMQYAGSPRLADISSRQLWLPS